MSVPNNGSSSKSPTQNENSDEISSIQDLESKVMQVGAQKYYIDMKQSSRSRFFKLVEVIPRSKRSRLVVPMTAAVQFCQKLEEVDKFATNYDPSRKNSDAKNEAYIFSVSLTTPGHRRYYFDLGESGQYLELRISYVYGDRRDNVHIVSDAIVEILNILNGFIERFPPLPGQDEEDNSSRPPTQRRNNNFDRNRRFYDNQRPGRQSGPPRQESSIQRRSSQQSVPLRVLDDPAPTLISLNQKGYMFEMVQGSNMFVRITETINGNRKATMHIPAEACTQFRDMIDMFSKSVKISDKPLQQVATVN